MCFCQTKDFPQENKSAVQRAEKEITGVGQKKKKVTQWASETEKGESRYLASE